CATGRSTTRSRRTTAFHKGCRRRCSRRAYALPRRSWPRRAAIAASPTSTSERRAPRSAARSAARRRPAAGASRARTPGRRICAGRRTRSTGVATCLWRRESGSTFRRNPDYLRVRALLRFVVLTVARGNGFGVAVARRFVAAFFAVAPAVFLTAGDFAVPFRTVPRAPAATAFTADLATTCPAAPAPLPDARVLRAVVAAGRSVTAGALRGARVPTVRRGEREGLRPAFSSMSATASSSVSESTLSRSGSVAFVVPCLT